MCPALAIPKFFPKMHHTSHFPLSETKCRASHLSPLRPSHLNCGPVNVRHVVPPFVECRTSPHCVAFDPAFPLREHNRMRTSLVSSYLSFMSRPVLLYHSQTVFVLASRASWPLSWPLLPFVPPLDVCLSFTSRSCFLDVFVPSSPGISPFAISFWSATYGFLANAEPLLLRPELKNLICFSLPSFIARVFSSA
jgi:hypothetical protein